MRALGFARSSTLGAGRTDRGQTPSRIDKVLEVRGIVGWMAWLFEAVAVAVLLAAAPIYAIVMFATGHAASGWKSVGVFAAALLYTVLLTRDVIKRPWSRSD